MDDWDLDMLEAAAEQRAHEKVAVARWALEVLRAGDRLVMSVATTGLDGGAQVIEMAVTDLWGAPRFWSMACPPPGTAIAPEATAVHGLEQSQLALAPGFAFAYEGLRAAVYGERLLVYNERFVRRVLDQTKLRWDIHYPLDVRGVGDLMPRYAAWCREWQEEYQTYRTQKLPLREALPRRAPSDCAALCLLLREMAGAVPEDERVF